jgi:hemerythrin-like domain-containing protein
MIFENLLLRSERTTSATRSVVDAVQLHESSALGSPEREIPSGGPDVADEQNLIDTRDMVALHGAFRRALADAPAQLAGVIDGDTETASRLGAYLDDVLWLLHAHHAGEDELLYPLLIERAPEQERLFAEMESQHAAVAETLLAAQGAAREFGASASATDAEVCALAIRALEVALEPHLSDEEVEVLPIAARTITPPEWGAMPAHALSHYGGERIWLPFGIAFEGMPEDIQERMLTMLPPPVSQMWNGGGSAAFSSEITAIRSLAP